MKTHSTIIFSTVLFFFAAVPVQAGLVDSNSITKDGIEYYFQTDKSVYTLSENVLILHTFTNPMDEYIESELASNLISPSEIPRASITDVHHLPQPPNINDAITIITSGIAAGGAVFIDGSNFERDGTSLRLDIYLTIGYFTVITPWSHLENIGKLPSGLYDLTVNAFDGTDLSDTFTYEFQVIPEPETILLLSAGILGIRAVNRTTSRECQLPLKYCHY